MLELLQAIFNADNIFEVSSINLYHHMLYLVRLTATHPRFDPIEIDQFVGGYPSQLMNSKIELGTLIFSKKGGKTE